MPKLSSISLKSLSILLFALTTNEGCTPKLQTPDVVTDSLLSNTHFDLDYSNSDEVKEKVLSEARRQTIDDLHKKGQRFQPGDILPLNLTGDTYQSNPNRLYAPASTLKLITSQIALEVLGPDYRFTTQLSWHQDKDFATQLEIIGSGDPTLTKKDLEMWAKEIYSRGVRSMGSIVMSRPDHNLWYTSRPSDGISDFNLKEPYGHFASFLNLDLNQSNIIIEQNLEQKWSGRWKDTNNKFPIQLKVQDLVLGQNADIIAAHPLFDSESKRVTGVELQVVLDPQSQEKRIEFPKIPVFDSHSWIEGTLISECRKLGIKIITETSLVAKAEDGLPNGSLASVAASQQKYSFYSKPLREILVSQNKKSINLYADALIKRASISAAGSESFSDGLSENLIANFDLVASQKLLFDKKMKTWHQNGTETISKSNPSDSESFHLIEGSGLSKKNKISPSEFILDLKYMLSNSLFDDLLTSLPIACVDGTLVNRLCQWPEKGHVKAKTGTLDGSYQLAGFLPVPGQVHPLAFSILTDTKTEYAEAARIFQDAIVHQLALFFYTKNQTNTESFSK